MIELNIFTNCTKSAPNTKLIDDTYQSFVNTFTNIPVNIWCDPSPNISQHKLYVKNLSQIFSNIYYTSGLSDGYINSILNSNADYLFMLEHDWIFNTKQIFHTLSELVEIMEQKQFYHLRFNKRANKPKLCDMALEYKNFIINNKQFEYCITPCLSNNPHIVHRKTYLKFIDNKYIIKKSQSSGIEELLTKNKELFGIIYGGFNYPATVKHTDGQSF